MQQQSAAKKTFYFVVWVFMYQFQNKLKGSIDCTNWYQCLLFPMPSETRLWEYTQWARDKNAGIRDYSQKLRDHEQSDLPQAWYVSMKIASKLPYCSRTYKAIACKPNR